MLETTCVCEVRRRRCCAINITAHAHYKISSKILNFSPVIINSLVSTNMNSLYSILVIFLYSLIEGCYSYNVIYAVNCGGPKHVDKNGIKYRKDDSSVGVASDYGMSMSIARVPPEDMILYQTERYNNRDFSYDVQISSDGEYVLVLKFAEVYFQGPNQKVHIYIPVHFINLFIFDPSPSGV